VGTQRPLSKFSSQLAHLHTPLYVCWVSPWLRAGMASVGPHGRGGRVRSGEGFDAIPAGAGPIRSVAGLARYSQADQNRVSWPPMIDRLAESPDSSYIQYTAPKNNWFNGGAMSRMNRIMKPHCLKPLSAR
jgi:hypothetical protein